ncbi:murein L,D-transpeptidase catalytic domain family protein [Novosphingobium sp. RD2P27]|uniref:Murein L,D-transpeptidase catalytic domain family protein n=1 Tax=Novosphingobium kalidii TaxID=3230299 RepID=A0ABV2D1I7_9SPHN
MERRTLMMSGAAAALATLGTSQRQWFTAGSPDTSHLTPMAPRAAQARPGSLPAAPKEQPQLVKEALAALDSHGRMVRHHDRVAIVDFSAPSSKPRLQILDVASGKTTEFLVAHGSGSDPRHTGFLQRFSNEPNSNASSKGAFVTANYYVGKHGRSQRLLGLDPTNNNALDRAIVLHGAWYANADMIPAHGKLGRSQGCFAVGERELARVFDLMGEGRMIYAARV